MGCLVLSDIQDTGSPYAQRVGPDFIPYITMNSGDRKDLDIGKTIKRIGENISTFKNHWVKKYFLNKNPKAQAIKQKSDL